MKRTSVLLVVPLLFLVGCRSSTRTIDIQGGELAIGGPSARTDKVAYTYSKDGSKVCVIKDLFEDHPTVEVRSRGDDALLATYPVTDESWVPVLFTDDSQGLVVVPQKGEAPTAKTIKIGEDLPAPATTDKLSFGGMSFNHDFTLVAGNDGVVVTNHGVVARVDVEEQTPMFDQFGSVWYKTNTGKWASVDREGHVVQVQGRPAYLVSDPQHHRGAMHLSDTDQDMEFEDAHAYVTAVWLHHDKAIGGVDAQKNPRNRAALVYVGADVRDWAFVPGRDEIAVNDADGTVYVPYWSR